MFTSLAKIAKALEAIESIEDERNALLKQAVAQLTRIADDLAPPPDPVVGLGVKTNPPTNRP